MKKRIIIVSILIMSVLCTATLVSACIGNTNPFIIEGDTITGLTWRGYKLSSIEIPDGITGIGERAFYNSSELTSLIIPSSVTYIGAKAFAMCDNLTRITVDKNNSKYVGEGNCLIEKESKTLIAGCNNSEIPDWVETIGDYAFSHCKKINEINIPDSVVSIGEGAFEYCDALQSVGMGDKLTSIGNMAFYRCGNLTDVKISDGVTSIGESAFANCSKLQKTIIPSGVTRIEKRLFSGCDNLSEVSIPSGVTYIGDFVFDDCVSLTKIYIPDSVEEMGDNPFRDCSSLVIEFQASQVPDEWKKFSYGSFLADKYNIPVILDSDNNDIANDGYMYILENDGIQYALRDNLAKVKGHTSISGDIEIAESINYDGATYQVREIDRYCFYQAKSIDNVTVPDCINKIGTYAFANSGLKRLALPSSVEHIGERAFFGCGDMKSISLPSGLSSIGEQAFNACIALESISVDNSDGVKNYVSEGDCLIEKATNKLILGCKNSLIPDYVKIIGNHAFYGSRYLMNINLPDGLTEIENFAFHSCVGLDEIFIPDSVIYMGYDVFASCNKDLIIYCQAQSQPTGWHSDWNNNWGHYDFYTKWGYKKK